MDELRPVAGRVPVRVGFAALLSIHRQRCIPATAQTQRQEHQHAQEREHLVSGLPSVRQIANTELHLIASRIYKAIKVLEMAWPVVPRGGLPVDTLVRPL